jgi:hypothetical protein
MLTSIVGLSISRFALGINVGIKLFFTLVEVQKEALWF